MADETLVETVAKAMLEAEYTATGGRLPADPQWQELPAEEQDRLLGYAKAAIAAIRQHPDGGASHG